MRNWLSPLMLLILGGVWIAAQPFGGVAQLRGEFDSPPVAHYIWTAPETGTPVEYYVVQILVNDVDIQVIEPVYDQAVNVEMDFGNKYMVRVAAVDAAGVQGTFSLWSVAYTPELGPPEF